jgi:hypothetical protein
MTRFRTLALALAAVLAAPSAPLPAQVSVISSTLEERPAAPGERYTGTVRVRNTSGEPQQARIYQTDYRFLADGRTFYEQPGTAPRSNAGWVRFNPSQLTLAPGEEAAVAYTVSVPAGGVRGSYWSVLMVETAQPPARASQRGVGITPAIRYAVQVATHVGQAERRIALQGARLTGEGAGRALEVDVVNTGEQADRLELRVDLFDADGAPAGRLASSRGLVYPGTSIHQRFEIPALPAGTYRALLVVDTGSDEVFGAEYTFRM